MKRERFEDFLNGYLAAAVFADVPEEHIHDVDGDDIEEDSIKQAHVDCETFLSMAQALIEDDEHIPGSWDDTPWNHAGRDFWYTRNGHGCGFWDGDWPKHGDELTALTKKFREMYIDVYNAGDELDPSYKIAIYEG